ncbi:ABC-F family ATP-binding cassette domain-containing protein [Fervidobacterium thailandense]|uniref:ABC transporter n=1 Tax=Fervidobacterium thailandense TaxID=1008305 RepID=A0A1E3G3H8_9BACT|nr:ABC-F family ATP-binding cassette domain-containing protein [Fervidobacterium thailandense]ODN30825.1 ABC transporter [Fervidobacterium thailandense]
MISLRSVSIEFPGKMLFSNFNATIFPKDRIGLMGKNGSGKSTLMKAIAGVFKDYHGEINISGKVLYMDQYRTFDAKTPFEYYMNVADTPEKEKQVRSILKGLGFNEEDWHRDISTFSGGERTKLQLGRLFVEEPDFLLLDEPTNFLDIEAIEFLKKLLLSFKGGYMIISHDRDFLRSVCNKFWEINNETIWTFDMPYDRYHEERKRIIETQQRQVANLQREIQRLREIIERYKKWGRDKFQKQAKSREKMLERMLEELENMPALYLEEEEKRIEIPVPESSGYVVLEVKNVSWNGLLKNVSFTIHQGDKVALIGPNGSGKSTLLKIIAGELQHEGTVTFGYKVNVAYVEQFVDQLDLENTVFDEIFEELPDQPDYVIRAYAGRFGFKGENVFKTVAELSGGERQILALAKVLLRKPNLLILDEPTNHMDLETVEALEDALKEYKGSVLIVSHDLELIRNVCNRFLTIKNGTLIEVEEPLYFSREKERQEKRKNFEFEERKKFRNLVKSIGIKLEQLEEREKELSRAIDEISKHMLHTNDYQELMALQSSKEELETQLLEVMEEIEKLKLELKRLTASNADNS